MRCLIEMPRCVIPAKAGVKGTDTKAPAALDSGVRWNDGEGSLSFTGPLVICLPL